MGKRPAPARGARRRTERCLALPLSPSLRSCVLPLKPPGERRTGVEGQLLCSPSIFFPSGFISALLFASCKVPVGTSQPQRVTDAHVASGHRTELRWCSCPGVGGEEAVSSMCPLKYILGPVKM